MEIRLVGAEVFHADGRTQTGRRTERQTEVRNLVVAFRSFANAPKNWRGLFLESFSTAQ